MGNQYDYIIIGSGIAGLMTAYYASLQKGGDYSILLISKGGKTENNTFYAQGGIAASVSKKDSISAHIKDTLIAGHHRNDPRTVNFIIKNAPSVIREMRTIGIRFASDLKLEGGHSKHRISYHFDSIGKELVEIITSVIIKHPNIKILRNHFVTDLIVHEKQCIGISVINNKQEYSRIKNLYAKKTVICTGGIGQLFEKTTNPPNATGDGIAMAYRAGCVFRDLDKIQFHPTTLDCNTMRAHNSSTETNHAISDKSRNTNKHRLSHLFLLSETLRGEGAYLLNKNLIRFMLKAHPLAELAPRDVISKEIFLQQKKGQVFLDLRHLNPQIIKQKYPTIFQTLKKFGYSPEKDLLPITPSAHYLCGGIHTDHKSQTSIKNLYAVGECAHTGLHGDNRLASNSLLEAIVMAKQATINPLPRKIQIPTSDASPRPQPTRNTNAPNNIKQKIKSIMWKNATPLATKKQLRSALKHLQSLPHPKVPSETLNMLQTAELILKAKLEKDAQKG